MQQNTSNIVFLFSGQGSHYRDMGKELYVADRVFKDSIDRADKLIYRNTGISLVEELYRYDEEVFDSVLITHPAIVAIEIAMTEVLNDRGIIPVAVAGISLGEFAAGVASGLWTGEDALVTSIEQAKLISMKVEEGGMTVVISPKTGLLTEYLDDKELYQQCVNFNGCFTVSGLRNELDQFDEFLGENGIVHQRLDVEYPFHSPFMELAKLYWNHDDSGISDSPENSAKMYSALLGDIIDKGFNSDYFWDVVSRPYDFPAVIREIERDLPDVRYVDLGPSGTMATFMKYITGTGAGRPLATTLLSPHHQGVDRLENFLKEFQTGKENSDLNRRLSKAK